MSLISVCSALACAARTFSVLALFCVVLCAQSAFAQTDAVCAEVRIEIRQKLSLERQGFDAVLRIRNGLTSAAVESVAVNILFTDELGNPVLASGDPNQLGAAFFVRLDGLEDLGAVDGSGVVAPASTGTARWLIVPAANSGGDLPSGRRYRVGARITYTLGGEARSVDVVPETITVRPQPRLALDYFLAGDVYSDDAFTPELEPAVPFTLGLRVRNVGAGVGNNVRIESSQPRIVENKLGLLIGFNLIGGFVDDSPSSASLALSLGNLQPGSTRMARWLMETTLSGRFDEIEARYSHADSLGGSLTSLIEGEPRSHLLVRDVLVDLPGRDGVRDFLARDGDALRVYESSGVDTVVTDASAVASLVTGAVPGQYRLTLPSQPGLTYARVIDPSAGTATAIQGFRADGSALPAENVWFTKRRNASLAWVYYLNVFDARGGGSFSLRTDLPPATASLSGRVFLDANANGAEDPAEPGLEGVSLTLDGSAAGAVVQRSTLSNAQGEFSFTGLPAGTFSIAVGAVTGLVDGVPVAGSAGGLTDAAAIRQIGLGVAQSADGYRFAKLEPGVSAQADLQLAPIEGPEQATAQQAVAYSLRARNLGPQGGSGSTQLTLPEEFEITGASASQGTFNASTGLWVHGSLAAGAEQSILLQGRFTSAGSFSFAAAISAVAGGSKDPDPSNNLSSVQVEVSPDAILTAGLQLSRSTRVLVWATCASGSGPACVEGRLQRWRALLQGRVPATLTSEPAEFRRALRSGDWNLVLVDGSLLPLESGGLINESRELLRRGGGLILSGTRDSSWARFETLAGLGGSTPLAGTSADLQLVDSEFFAAGSVPVLGPLNAFNPTNGRALGAATGGEILVAAAPAAAVDARVLAFGFDLLALLEGGAGASLTGSILAGAAANPPAVLLTASPIALAAEVRREARSAAGVMELGVELAPGFELLAANPAPDSALPLRLDWLRSVPPTELPFVVQLQLRTPPAAGQVALRALADLENEVAERSLTLALRDRAVQATAAVAALEGLTAAPGAQAEALARSRSLVQQALAEFSPGNGGSALSHLLSAIEALRVLPQPEARSAELGVSWLLAAMAREAGEPGTDIFANGFEAVR